MSKKFDIKRTLGNPAPPLSIEAVEEMTQLIHNKKTPTEIAKVVTPEPKEEIIEVAPSIPTPSLKTAEKAEKSKRGRKPNQIIETERQLRVSVDLPESTFIQLKVLVIQQQTDMKSYIRKLVEKDLARK